MTRYLIACALLLAVSTAPAEAPQRLSAEILWQIERLGDPLVSPNGKQVVVPVTTYPEDGGDAETRLWLLSANDPVSQRPLTVAGGKASSPVFSPDGSQLAFVSQRDEDEAGQAYVMPMSGPGEAQRLTDVPTGVSALRWVGDHIYFVSSVWPGMSFEEMAEKLEADEESKVSAHVWTRMPYAYFDSWLDEERQNHVFRIPAGGGDVEPLTIATGLALAPADVGTGDYDVSPDGRTLAFVADSAPGEVYANPDVFLLVIGDETATNITPDNPANDTRPMFSPDGRRLAISRQRIAGFYADQVKILEYDLASGRSQLLHEDWDRSAEGLVWAPDSKGLFGAIDDAGTRRAYYLPRQGGAPRAITGMTDFDRLSIARDGTLVARNQSPLYPPRVVRVDTRRGAAERLDRFNDELLADVDVGRYESVTYTGADGDDIQMWVHYPPGFDPSKKYPLFLLIHGGPHGAVTEDFHFRWNAQTFSSWGYVTAWPNFHGSTGFGQDFADSINPDWLTKPYADVIAAAGWFEEQPWIDTERMVAGGGSYGGYLSTILLGREHPFNALVIHAAVYDMYAQNSADFAVHEERYGPYWERPDIYRDISPHYFAAEFETPSLVLHGQKDLRVPVGQAFELFRALQMQGVDSRLVYYPDENHWILSRDNSLHWYGEVRGWVERYAAPGPE